MIPIWDKHSGGSRAFSTWGFLVLCVAVAVAQAWASEPVATARVLRFGVVPMWVFQGVPAAQPDGGFPYVWTLVTNIVFHAGWLHLCANVMYLSVFGPRLEVYWGAWVQAGFLVLVGAASSWAQVSAVPGSTAVIIGASGAISGLLGAYVVRFPRANITVLVPGYGVRWWPAWGLIGCWVSLQVAEWGLQRWAGETGVGVYAHIGGFLIGFLAMAWRMWRESVQVGAVVPHPEGGV